MEYVPFDATEEEDAARQVLRPGVPDSMRPALVTWLWNELRRSTTVRPEQLHDIENNLDISFGMNPSYAGHIFESGFRKLAANLGGQELVRVADLLLFKADRSVLDHESLGRLLSEGRSQYEVVRRGTGFRLATRLPEGVQEAAEALMKEPSAAGSLMSKAWSKVYDLKPDDSGAYAAAVKAVEAATLPVLGIYKDTATISDAVRAIEKKDSSWRLPFLREHTEYPSKDVLLGMLKSLYRGQRDRHGSEAYSDVTHDEAEAAVLMAVTLVGWFSRDLVQERDLSTYG